ncbi:MAG: DUF4445 domain-containing protein [Planctomycetes bacterium]|nr:DUF4445 domain-containing protein [Planctomycetota bacterium]
MALVTFLPSARSTTVVDGTSLLDSAGQAGVTIAAPCGGEGACGECRVRIESGSVERVSRGCLSPDALAEGWVLACGCRVVGDVTVGVTESGDGEAAQIVTGEGGGISSRAVAPQTAAFEPPAVKHHLLVESPSIESSFSDLERLVRAIRAGAGIETVSAGLPVLRELAGSLRSADGRVTATVDTGDRAGAAEIVRIEPGDTTTQQAGLAIDVGTTTCVVSLIDLAGGHTLGTAADYNGQLSRGADIISRINYAKTPERTDELRRLVLNTINGLIEHLCAEHGVGTAQIDNAAIAGNTTMVHLLLGLDPEYIRLEPYTPTVNHLPRLRGREVGLTMNPEAYVRFAPGVGSYVGGDITAGLLQTAFAAGSHDIRLFLDIGTNGEVVVGNSEWLMACAASAGPAFEGSGVGCGMRAGPGAIERVRIHPESGEAAVTVIGGGRPRGVCGSGMIDLLAELRACGLLDPAGRLDPSRGGGRISQAAGGGRNLAYTIVRPGDAETGKPIAIDERDIQNLLRTKAAVYSACAIMLKSVGLDFDAIAEVYVAGGFGRFLDLEKSITVGLLPDLPLERFTYLGNSAVAGAQRMLCRSAAREDVVRLADRMTYLELNADPAYMSEYTAALFLPHTDLDRFPTVRSRVGTR